MKHQHKQYILENAQKLSVDQIAKDLNLRMRTVKKFLNEENMKQEQVPRERAVPLPLLSRKWVIAVVFSLIVLGLCNYTNSINNPFIWDDFNFIERNPNIRSWQNIPAILKENVTSGVIQKESSSYRPLQMLTYLADYSIWRLDPKGYHLTNIFLHLNGLKKGFLGFFIIFLIVISVPHIRINPVTLRIKLQ